MEIKTGVKLYLTKIMLSVHIWQFSIIFLSYFYPFGCLSRRKGTQRIPSSPKPEVWKRVRLELVSYFITFIHTLPKINRRLRFSLHSTIYYSQTEYHTLITLSYDNRVLANLTTHYSTISFILSKILPIFSTI